MKRLSLKLQQLILRNSLLERAVCLLVIFVAFVAHTAFTEPLKAIPELRYAVTDQINLLQPAERAALERKLSSLADQKGSRIAVLITDTTAPEEVESYSIRVFDKWKLGREHIDDGILILVAIRDRALRIEIGRGLEGAIPDAISKRIGDDVITPHLKSGDYYNGINLGVDSLIALINGEQLPPAAADALSNRWSKRSSFGGNAGPLLAAAFGIAQVLYAVFGVFGAVLAGLVAGALGLVFGLGIIFSFVIGCGVMLLTIIFALFSSRGGGGFYTGGGYSSGPFGGGGGFSGGGFTGGGGSASGGGSTSRW